MDNTELKHILIAYKSTNIGLQQAHDEILRLFSVVGLSEQLSDCAVTDKELEDLMKVLYPKDNSKRFRR